MISIEIIFNNIIHIYFIFHIFYCEHWPKNVNGVILFTNFDLNNRFSFFWWTSFKFKWRFFFSNETNLKKHFNIMIYLIISTNNWTRFTLIIWWIKLNVFLMSTFVMNIAKMFAIIFVKVEYFIVKYFQRNNEDLFFWFVKILMNKYK